MVASALAYTLLVASIQSPDASVARAESLLARGELAEARSVLEPVLRSDREHQRALVLLGRVHLAWPVIGRWRAWRLFERAARIAPTDPEPRYWQMRIGMHLGGADGERLARDAIYDVWRLDPTYPGTWEAWRELYRGEKHRLRALEILDAHPDDPFVEAQRALLLLELERYDAADAVLATLPLSDPAVLARRAQTRLERGDPAGLPFYRDAIARAAADTSGVLWEQVRTIATSEETDAYRDAAPSARPDFFEGFWARREPNLTTPANERIVEHFERLRHARGTYPLLHPMARRHHSRYTRALEGLDSEVRPEDVYRVLGVSGRPGGARSSLEETLQEIGLGVRPSDLAGEDSLSIYKQHGYDARGLLYLRWGRPIEMWIDPKVEIWQYSVDGEQVFVTFDRPGDVEFAPLSRHAVAVVSDMLGRDETSLSARLGTASWVATFRGPVRAQQLVYVGASPDSGAAALWDRNWNEVARTVGVAPFVLVAPPGRYRIGVDVHRAGELGRIRENIDVPDLSGASLRVSSMLAGVGGMGEAPREAVARAMPADLTVPSDTTLTLFAEIYNLGLVNGRARYEATYTFDALDSDRVVTLRFTRTLPVRSTTVERVELAPGRIPRGRYAIVLRVRDLVSPRAATSTRVEIEWR